jgi:hypothetical protein
VLDVRFGSLADKALIGQNSLLSALVQKRTNAGSVGLSAKCQKRTSIEAALLESRLHVDCCELIFSAS